MIPIDDEAPLPAGNLLGTQTSPYLLQHSNNPVHWRPWGAQALSEAAALGKPILLSVGYAACHWCHVMAHESFEDPAIARLMNEHFVNIKVDREERPDIDQIYMAALHALGEQGGWPLTMFLTPEGDPFWGGTYFPPSPRFGRPGFPDVLRNVAAIFAQEPGRIEQNRQALRQYLARPLRIGTESIGRSELDDVARRLSAIVDPILGGVRGAPKFPSAPLLELLWRGADRLADESMQALVLRTLDAICKGGIRDHVGGGFARYAVDERWLVPHFEKMLYDNAQLLDSLALAHARTRSPLYRFAAIELVEWLGREMMAGDGQVFAASLDADSEGHEGRFYIWTPETVAAALDTQEASFFKAKFDIAAEGNWEGVSIPNRIGASAAEVAGFDDVEWQPIRRKLLAARAQRVGPARDDKILADWNGLMIAALARAGRHFGRPDWLERAERAYRFVVESMMRDGRLGHSWRHGRLTVPGLASDHAMMIRASLALAEVTTETDFIRQAEAWVLQLEEHHVDAATGGYLLAADDVDDLILRPMSALDDAVPNHNAIMAENLLRLAIMTGEDKWRHRADAVLTGLSGEMNANMFGHAALFNALDMRLTCAEIVVVGHDRDAEAMHAAALDLPHLFRTVLRVANVDDLPPSHVAFAKADGRRSVALVCLGERCSLPVTTPAALISTYDAMRQG